jgi:hypothetical protein
MKFLRHNWQIFAALGLALCLVVLMMHPAGTHAPVLSAMVLLPVMLFGLVLVPRSLWPAADFEQRSAVPVLCRAQLFERPPPSRKN